MQGTESACDKRKLFRHPPVWKLGFVDRDMFPAGKPLIRDAETKLRYSALWTDFRRVDCEGLPMDTKNRMPPDTIVPNEVDELLPMVTFDRSVFVEECRPRNAAKWSFSIGVYHVTFPAHLPFGPGSKASQFLTLCPGLKEGSSSVSQSLRRLQIPLRILLFYDTELYGEFWIPGRTRVDWYRELSLAARVTRDFHPQLQGAVTAAEALFRVEPGTLKPSFSSDDSRLEAKTTVWMDVTLPGQMVESLRLTKWVTFFWARGLEFETPHTVPIPGGWVSRVGRGDIILIRYSCAGRLVIRKQPSESGSYVVSLPVIISEINYDGSPTLRPWVLKLPQHFLSSVQTVSKSSEGLAPVLVPVSACERCSSVREHNRELIRTSYLEPQLRMGQPGICAGRKRRLEFIEK